MTTWQKDMTTRIGDRVKQLRGDRTALWLSEKTGDLGMKISRSAISELEGGKRRSISVSEWLILAAALDTPPALLLFPAYPDGIIEFIPGVDTYSHSAVDWVSGRQTLTTDGDHPQLDRFEDEKVELTREREGLINAAVTAWGIRGGKGNPIEALEQVENRQRQLNARLRRIGGTVGSEDNGEG